MLRSVLVKGIPELLSANFSKALVSVTSNGSPSLLQTACISSKTFRDRSYKKPDPWPYKEKKYTELHARLGLDDTLARFDENTQLVVVEGNIGVGKSDFAKKLADELEMLHLPEVNIDDFYVDKYGFDLRSLDHLMPLAFKSLNIKQFYENPYHPNVPKFQAIMLLLRLEQYMEALAHILNTGQGVVLERCAYSDFVFVDAMHKAGYVGAGVKSFIHEMRENGLHIVPLRPTLIIYLDASVDTLMDRIHKRNIEYETRSKVLTKEYLDTIEQSYKQNYLKEMKKHCEVVVYDWNNFGDPEAVVEDIERLNFDKYEKYDIKHEGWRNTDKLDWVEHRLFCSNYRMDVLMDAMIFRYDVPEMMYMGDDWVEYEEILEMVSNIRYQKGFNPYLGDKGWLFKVKDESYWERQKFTMPFIRKIE